MKLILFITAHLLAAIGIVGVLLFLASGLAMATGLGDFSPYQFIGGLSLMTFSMWSLEELTHL